MKITNVILKQIEGKEKLKAIADIVIEDSLVIHNIKLFEKTEGEFSIAMPSRKIGEKYLDIVHPINKETREEFETVIVNKYKESLETQTTE